MTAENHQKKQLNPAIRKYCWKPGQSGNPKGRPKKPFCIPEILRQISDEIHEGNLTKLESLLRLVYDHALAGEPWAVNFIADRLEGKPKQALSVQTEPEPKPIKLIEI